MNRSSAGEATAIRVFLARPALAPAEVENGRAMLAGTYIRAGAENAEGASGVTDRAYVSISTAAVRMYISHSH